MPSSDTPAPKISFLAFFLLWAERMHWTVPDLHVRACYWLEHRGPLAVLMMPRGHAKSTLLGCYNAWRFYCDPTYRILHQGDQDGTADKTSRDTKYILQHHPLTINLVDIKGEIRFWWVPGAEDPRNPSMQAAGILSNITSSRADEIQNDDVEVPKNIATPEAREKLRFRLSEQVHILVPGGRHLYVGTPHTHETIYQEQIELGADALVIRMFEHEHRIESGTKARYRLAFAPDFVFAGIGKLARLMQPGVDYRMDGTTLVMTEPHGDLIDCYAGAVWPERFDAEELTRRRRKCRTLNEWDSQYQLHSKPVRDVRLDPARITPYAVNATLHFANDQVGMFLGSVQIVGASLRWDPASGKLKSDVSAAALVLQDAVGRRYLHRLLALTGEVAEFADNGKDIIGGQVVQLCELVKALQLPRIVLEHNGIGQFAPHLLKAALQQRHLRCGVIPLISTANKNKRILETLEPLLLTRGQLWAHVDVLRGPLWDQMQDWNPAVANQPDDYLDAIAGAIVDTPERIGKIVGNTNLTQRHDWSTGAGVHEVEFER